MQAIILAAGMGKRLGKYTKNNTKCMISVNGEKLIDRTLNILSRCSLSRIIIVIGYKGRTLKEHIEASNYKKINIEFIENPIYDKTNNIYSLSLAKDKMIEDDTILLESDLIYEESIIKMLIENQFPNLALVAKWEPWMDGTVVRIDEDNHIVSFVSKDVFNYNEIGNYYKTVNIYKFSKEFSQKKYIPFLNAYCQSRGNNEYYEQVLRVLTFLEETDLKALPINNKKWYEIDDIQDLDIAETIFANDDNILQQYHQRYGGYWRFPKLIDFCYLVNPFFPPRSMVEEMKASFETLLTEYPSGMNVNTLLASKYFGISSKHIAVGNGASELIKTLMENFTGKLGVIYPTFEEYPNRLDKNQIIAFISKRQDYMYDAADLKSFFDDKDISSLLLINPDNPSGNFIPKAEVLRLAKWCKEKNIRLIVDESFVDFSENHTENSLLLNDILESNDNLVIVKSISKSYGVPGLRLGIIASANKSLISMVKKNVPIWNINSFAEYYMQIFGKYKKHYITACNKFIEERKRFQNLMAAVPFIRVIPSQANYFMIRLNSDISPETLSKILLKEYNILIKDCNNKHGLENQGYIRIAVKSAEENNTLIHALKHIMSTLAKRKLEVPV
jgi:histidinol-phosphate/aromatic aminotransferase/cobyric acid decarboxylase-like protein/choline kinase